MPCLRTWIEKSGTSGLTENVPLIETLALALHPVGHVKAQHCQRCRKLEQSPSAEGEPGGADRRVQFAQDVVGGVEAGEALGEVEGEGAEDVGAAFGGGGFEGGGELVEG